MGPKTDEEKLLTGYLLDNLSEDDKSQIEARFFADDEYYQSVLVAEDELIYNYLRGGLSSAERQKFEAQIASSPSRREKVQFVKSLMAEAAVAAPMTEAASTSVTPAGRGPSQWQAILAFLTGRNAALQFAMAAVMLLLGVASFWLWSQTRQLNAELELAQARQRDYEQIDQNTKQQTNKLQKENEELAQQLKLEQAAREQLVKEQEQFKTQADNGAQPGAIIPFTLEPGVSRSETDSPKPLQVPRLASRIQLTLGLGSDDGKGKYRAELSSRGGTAIWSQRGLSAKPMPWGNAVVLQFPAGVLKDSEYDLTLKRALGNGTFEDVGYYSFKVVKQ